MGGGLASVSEQLNKEGSVEERKKKDCSPTVFVYRGGVEVDRGIEGGETGLRLGVRSISSER